MVLRISTITEVDGESCVVMLFDGEDYLPCNLEAPLMGAAVNDIVQVIRMEYCTELNCPKIVEWLVGETDIDMLFTACSGQSTPPPPCHLKHSFAEVESSELFQTAHTPSAEVLSKSSPESRWTPHIPNLSVTFPRVGSLESARESVAQRLSDIASETVVVEAVDDANHQVNAATRAIFAANSAIRRDGESALLFPENIALMHQSFVRLSQSLASLCGEINKMTSWLGEFVEPEDLPIKSKHTRRPSHKDPVVKKIPSLQQQPNYSKPLRQQQQPVSPRRNSPPQPSAAVSPTVALVLKAPPFLRSNMFVPEDGLGGFAEAPPTTCTLRLALQYSIHIGSRGSPCFWKSSEEVIYPCGSVVIIQNVISYEQQFFTGHTEAVLCIAQHPICPHIFASAQQQESLKKSGTLLVWDAKNVSEITRIEDGISRGASCVGFSPDGILLAVICMDSHNKLVLFNWMRKTLLCSVQTSLSSIHAMVWNQFAADTIVTLGVNYMRFHTIVVTPDENQENVVHAKVTDSRPAILQRSEKTEAVTSTCVCFLSASVCVTGTREGSLYIFENGTRVDVVKGAHNSPVLTLCRTADGTILSGSKSGELKVWVHEKSGLLCIRRIALQGSNVEDVFEDATPTMIHESPPILSEILYVKPSYETALHSVLVSSTSGLFIIEDYMTDTPHVMRVQDSHTADVRGMAPSPSGEHFLTVGDDGSALLWAVSNAEGFPSRVLCKQRFEVGGRARCVAFSHKGNRVAIGFAENGFIVYDVECASCPALLSAVALAGTTGLEVSSVSFSPDDSHLAVCYRSGNVEVHAVAASLSKLSVCKVQSSGGARCLAWSRDGQCLHLYTYRNELMYFSVTKGLQILSSQHVKDIVWETWNAPVGWPVSGLWQDKHYTNPTDLTEICVSPSRSWLLLGDTHGRICTAQFPALPGRIRRVKQKAHCGQVLRVAFLNATTALSLGHDKALHVWNLQQQQGK